MCLITEKTKKAQKTFNEKTYIYSEENNEDVDDSNDGSFR